MLNRFENHVFVTLEESYSVEEVHRVKQEAGGKTIFVKIGDFQVSEVLEHLGFKRLEERINNPLFFAFDSPKFNRKNLYVWETTPDYIDEMIALSTFVYEALHNVSTKHPEMTFEARFQEEYPVFLKTFRFKNTGAFSISYNVGYYDWHSHYRQDSEKFPKRDPHDKENLKRIIEEMFEQYVGK